MFDLFQYKYAVSFVTYCFFVFQTLLGQSAQELKLTEGNLQVLLQPDVGGRISQIYYKSKPLLSELTNASATYGSVWWPGPQSLWNWPPPTSLDKNRYDFEQKDTTVVCYSAEDSITKIQLKKIYRLLNEHHLQITYEATNCDTKPIQFSHWEVTRIMKKGEIIFPLISKLNEAVPENVGTIKKDERSNHKQGRGVSNSIYSLKLSDTTNSFEDGSQKKFFDGKNGWSAYMKNSMLLIKVFPDVLKERIAPGQGEIEIYIDKSKPFVELEQHSQYITLPSKKTSLWKVDWLLYDMDHPELKEITNLEEYIAKTVLELE